MNKTQPFDRPTVYRFRIRGHLDPQWSDWFEGLTITREPGGETLLCGVVTDQASLYGLLKKVRDMGLGLISVRRVECDLQEIGTQAAERGGVCIHCRKKRGKQSQSRIEGEKND